VKGLNIKKRKLLREIGLQIGLLFQIMDDLIDL
jgi:geranylgeranyl pyrophosphate synthase